MDRRALEIGWRLTRAMADLCPQPRPGLGWSLHRLDSYRPGLRPSASAVFGLADGELGVLAVAPDGPAAQAGVREGDVVLGFGAARFDGANRAIAVTADHAPLAADLERIEAEIQPAPVAVRVWRDGRALDLIVTPALHCPWPVQIEPSPRLYAASDGQRVAVSSAMAAQAARDDDLAFVIAHELAHALHPPEPGSARRNTRAREQAADRLGLILTARAGYDTSGVGDFMRALGRLTVRLPLDPHPPSRERAAALDRLHLEIETARGEGRTLTP